MSDVPVPPAVTPPVGGKPNWDAKVEEALAPKPPTGEPAKVETAAPVDFTKFHGALELLSKGDRVKAIRELVKAASDGKLTKDEEHKLAFEYSASIGEGEAPLTMDAVNALVASQVEITLTSKEKARLDAEETAKKTREAAEQTEVQGRVATMLTEASAHITDLGPEESAKRYPWVKRYGAPADLYKKFVLEDMKAQRLEGKTPEVPKPEVIFAKINTYWDPNPPTAETKKAATNLKEHAAAAFEKNRPAKTEPTEKKEAVKAPVEGARERLRALDRERRDRVNMAK